jgi:hypothetical protein
MAAGAGIRRDEALGVIKSRDATPTVATALGLCLEATEGDVLSRPLD